MLVIWRLVLWLYPPEKEALRGGVQFLDDSLQKMGPWTRMEKHALFLMSCAIALWATDLIHHISPAVIGIGVGLLAAVRGVGILGLEDLKRLNYLPVFFTATAISMGVVLLRTKALSSMTAVALSWMWPWGNNAFSLAFLPYLTAL